VQLAGSVNTYIVGNAAASIPIVSPVDPNWIINVIGTSVDTGAQPFPTIPSSINANRLYYPGLSRSYVNNAGYGETPSHRQIQFATQDIPSIQLTIRRGVSPDVIARWQLAASQLGVANA